MMSSVTALIERQAVVDAIHEWCRSIDCRDWAAMALLVTDPVHIDYSSNGSPAAEMPVGAWIERLRTLHGFDQTLHMVSNLAVVVDGDAATCTSYVNAMHFLTEDGAESHAYACGRYTHALIRDGARWRIRSVTFDLAGRHSGSDQFVRAFTRARAIAPSRAFA
jgi:ketosteroid isomerase-like protein